MSVLKPFVIFIIFVLFYSCTQCSGRNYERELVRKILHDYDISVKPSHNATEALNVTFGLALTQIIDVDERNQILTTNCWLNQQWIDYSLQWKPADYGGIKVVRIPAQKVWRPDIILYNNADSQYNLAILSTNVIVEYTGNLTWLSTAIFKSSCQINVEYFPFDEQQCEMKFASWTYDGFYLNLIIQTEEGDLSNYVSNGEWDLILMKQKRNVVYYSCCNEPYPDITYKIILRRRPLFYVFNLILPCVLISGLALLSFYMPSDSGEKVTLGITTLLSMTVFLMVIGESMPPTSEKLPLIGLYYGVTISLVSFATGLSVVTLNVHHRGMRGRELPLGMKKFIFNILARIVFLRLDFPKREETDETSSSNEIRDHPGSSARKLPMGDSWRIVYPDLSTSGGNLDPCDAHHSLLGSWTRQKSEQNQFYSSYGNVHTGDKYGTSCGSTRFRPIMKVRGIPSVDGSGYGTNREPFYHQPHHNHRVTCDDSVVNRKSRQFDEVFPSAFTPPPSQTTKPQHQPWEHYLTGLLERIVGTMEKNESRMSDQDRKDTIKLEWQQAALVLDRLLLWIFVVATIGATFGILYMSPHTKLFTT